MSGIRRIDAGWAVRVAGVASLVAHQAMPILYSPPRLTLAYPAPGLSVPSDNPAVVFRYAPGEVSDPLDLRTFAITVDGADRTQHFRVTADAAWGLISERGRIGLRAHDVRARICSVRGACSEAAAVVTVAAPVATTNGALNKERRRKMIDVVLEAARRLLNP